MAHGTEETGPFQRRTFNDERGEDHSGAEILNSKAQILNRPEGARECSHGLRSVRLQAGGAQPVAIDDIHRLAPEGRRSVHALSYGLRSLRPSGTAAMRTLSNSLSTGSAAPASRR